MPRKSLHDEAQPIRDRAMLRDASWYRRPDGRGMKQYHIVPGTDPHRPACGLRMYMAEFTAEDPADVPAEGRCRRHGCQQRWPA